MLGPKFCIKLVNYERRRRKVGELFRFLSVDNVNTTYAVEEDEGTDCVVLELVVTEAHAAEEDSKHDETEEKESTPETGNESSDGDDHVSDGKVEESLVTDELRSTSGDGTVTDGGENDGRVESETVESDVESEPRPSATEKDLSVLPLAEVTAEVLPTSLRSRYMLNSGLRVGDVSSRRKESINIGGSLLDVAFDIHGETRSFGEGETEVESDGTRNSTETDEETPGEIEVVSVVDGIVENLLLESGENTDGDEGGSELSPTLRPEGSDHHATTDTSSSEFGSDDSRERVISSNSDTPERGRESRISLSATETRSAESNSHDETPHDKNTDDRNGGTVTSDSLTKSCDNDWKKRA